VADNTLQTGSDTIRDKDRAGIKTQIVGLDLGIGTGTESLMTGAMPVSYTNTTGSGTFTAVDAVVAAPVGDGTIVTGASTAGSVIAVAIPAGHVAWTLLLKGLTASQTAMTIYSEASTNSTTGTDGDWVEIKGRRTGTAPGTESVNYAFQSNGYYRGNAAGFTWFRVRLLGSFTAGATAAITLTKGQGATFLNSGIPAGSSSIGTVVLATNTPVIAAGTASIGTVGLNAGTNTIGAITGTGAAGTPATGVQTVQGITGGTAQPVSGTFWQTTQPVSLATAPTTPVTGTFFQATQPVSLAAAVLPTPSTLFISTTAAVTTATTATIPAAGAGLFHYITSIEIQRYAGAALTGAAAPVVVTTTNLPGSPAWTFDTAAAIGTSQIQLLTFAGNPLKSSVANTATTIAAPSVTSGLWRINIAYYTSA
jgi:hypothetical protein